MADFVNFSFQRASIAYKQDGTQVAANVPRYEYQTLSSPVWQDTFDTDQLSQYTSGGDSPATWSVSSGVLTGTDGAQATLLKNGLTLDDCDIVVNTDQAYDGRIVARYQDNNNYYLLAIRDDSGSRPAQNLRIYKRVAGTYSPLDVGADMTWPCGTAKQVKFSLHGSTLEAYFDGVKVISVTDTTFTSGGVGLGFSVGTFRVLDFTVYSAQQGIMVEEGTTNLVPTPQTLADWDFGAGGSYATDNSAVSPDGNMNAATYTATSTAHIIRLQVGVTAGATYTFSWWAKLGTATKARYSIYRVDNLVDIISGFYNATTEWNRFSVTFSVPSDCTQIWIAMVRDSGVTGTWYLWRPQLEQKPYATSFVDGTRSPETLTTPTTGFTKGAWTVNLWYTPMSNPNVANLKILWHIYIDANNFYRLLVRENGGWWFSVKSGGTEYIIATNGPMTEGQTYFITITGNGSVMRLFVNGAQIGTDTSYVEPVGTLPTNMYVGCAVGGNQANGIITDFTVLGRAIGLAEHVSMYYANRVYTRASLAPQAAVDVQIPVTAPAYYSPELAADVYTNTQTLLDKYNVKSVQVTGSVDGVWQCTVEIVGRVELGDQECIVVAMPDHTGANRVVFAGVLPTQEGEYDYDRRVTVLRGYDYAYYLTRQYVPADQLYAPAWREPSETIRLLLGGDKWLSTTGIMPYRLVEYHSYDPNNLVWGDISRPFKWGAKTSKRSAIRELEDYTGYVFTVKCRTVGSSLQPCAYYVSNKMLDDANVGLDLPEPLIVVNPDPYLVGPVTVEKRGEERYNKVTVQGFDAYGVLHSYTKQNTSVASGEERPVEYLEIGAYDTDYKCALRADELWYYYAMRPRVYTARFHSRCDLQLWQRVRFSGYEELPEEDLRITRITYTMTEGRVTVDVELVPETMIRSTSSLKRAASPFWSRETSILVSHQLAQLPQVEVGTVTDISGLEATVTTERGTIVKARIVTQ